MVALFLLGFLIFAFLAVAVMFGSKRYVLPARTWKETFSIYLIFALTCLAICILFEPKKAVGDPDSKTPFFPVKPSTIN